MKQPPLAPVLRSTPLEDVPPVGSASDLKLSSPNGDTVPPAAVWVRVMVVNGMVETTPQKPVPVVALNGGSVQSFPPMVIL